jgi:hypothetical protein
MPKMHTFSENPYRSENTYPYPESSVHVYTRRSIDTLPVDLRDYAAGDAVLGVLLLRCADSDFGERQVLHPKP